MESLAGHSHMRWVSVSSAKPHLPHMMSRAVISTACALFCFSESTSSMPARDWQCRGQSFLLLVPSKNNVLLQSSLCSNGCGTDDDDDDDDNDDDDELPIGRCELELS